MGLVMILSGVKYVCVGRGRGPYNLLLSLMTAWNTETEAHSSQVVFLCIIRHVKK